MPTLLIAAASAALLAALVTELSQRFWSDSYIALLVITFIALLINGLFNARLRQKASQNTSAQAQPQRQTERKRSNNDRDTRSASDRPSGDSKKPARDNKPPRNNNNRPANRGDQDSSGPAREDSQATGPVENGTVKWFNRSKGYGFIVRENGEEIFVHQRSIASDGDRNQRPVLNDGQQVSFVVSHQEKGAQAEQVKTLD
jgi:cold shock CspA family protein